jgi:hypothetical protein
LELDIYISSKEGVQGLKEMASLMNMITGGFSVEFYLVDSLPEAPRKTIINNTSNSIYACSWEYHIYIL